MYVINHEQVVIVPRKKIRMTFIITLTVLCYFGFGSAFLQKFDGLSRRTFALPLRRRFFDRGDTTMPTVTTLINENIKSDPVRLSAPKPDGEEGEEIKLGIYSLSEALKLAAEMQLDLIMINPKIEPAICKIADYGKFKFNNDKKKREHSAKQKQTTLKELKSSFKVDQHDFDVRVRAARKALSEGDRVRIAVTFKGREHCFTELGFPTLARYFNSLSDIAITESPAKLEGNTVCMIISPKKLQQKDGTLK